MTRLKTPFALVFAALSVAGASAQEHEDINSANNPLTPKVTINLQNYYIP